jgi:tRNA nucleotidyltransferase (CCA-adding enzyme)
MKYYLVGGAIRDKLLGLPIHDHDWVVVNGSREKMIAKGFIPVGKKFPVFLHPKTKEEYALARTEKKSGIGYQGFTFDTSAKVTLEEDLKRRDLTINAMAMDDKGNIIDPYHGQEDLKNKILRHVSHTFHEDPLRVLRVARFAASYQALKFHISTATLALLKDISSSGELKNLTPERIWHETLKALKSSSPTTYFEKLIDVNAFTHIFPRLPQITETDPSLKALENTSSITTDPYLRFAVFISSINKMTPIIARNFLDESKIPRKPSLLILNTIQQRNLILDCITMTPEKILKLLHSLNAFRDSQHLHEVLEISSILFKLNVTDKTLFRQKYFLQQCEQEISRINYLKILNEKMLPADKKQIVQQKRLRIIQDLQTQFQQN